MTNSNIVQLITDIARMVDYVLEEQMGLAPPEQYDVNARDGRVYVTATFDPITIGRMLKQYENPDTLRILNKALDGLPVVMTQKTGWRYIILVSGNLNLPRSMDFPGFGDVDIFRLGVCLRGEVAPLASRLGNVIIGANQGAGKSNVLKLFAHQARRSGWKLFICDPDGHTFNPDVWNSIASSAVASSPEELLILTDRIYGEIADRAAMFRQAAGSGIPPADIDAYNKTQSVSMPRIGLFIEEANSYMGDKKIFKGLADLLRRGRKWGLHIFLAGHEWHKDVVPAEVNDMLQTRIGLTVANDETANVVLRSHRWAKWVMGKPAGRGVIRIDQYQPMQFYRVTDEMEREWLSGNIPTLSPLPDEEKQLVERAIRESDGRMSIPLLKGWGMDEWKARTLLEQYETRGWLEKDAAQKNARHITAKLAGLLSNTQTTQTASNTHLWSQTGLKLSQTPDVGLGTMA